MFIGDEKEGKNGAVPCCLREGDEGCVQHCGAEEIDGRVDLPKVDGVVREIGLEFVDTLMSDNEPVLTSLIESWRSASDEWRFTDDRREQSSGAARRVTEPWRATQSVQGRVRA